MDEIISSKIKNYLDRLAQSKRRPSSFIFFGTDEEGKIGAAFYFIRKISGKTGDDEFLGRMRAGIHPDIVIIEPETVEDKKGRMREKEIVIEQIRKAQGRMKFFPYELNYKFCIIKKAQKLNAEASNALLKILEEPTASTILILLAGDVDSVLPTISSRCAALRFSRKDLPAWSEENRKRLREIFIEDIFDKFNYAEKVSKDKNGAIEVLKDWEAVMADSMRNLADKNNSTDREKIRKIASMIRENRGAIDKMDYSSANPRSILENLFLGLQWK
ncbi:MAG: hypothetical protein WC831_02145 [Parcubacteria group bacterium]|jgi:DNA polymerase-3 subunit delta'